MCFLELKSITWARYIDNSVLRLPFDQRTSGVNPNKAHNLGFGYVSLTLWMRNLY